MSAWRVPPADLPEDVEAFLAGRGAAQVNLYRALANSPDLVRAWRTFLWDVRDRCEAPRSLRELVVLRCAVRHASEYEWAHHAAMARAAGVREEQIAAVIGRSDADCFGPDERLALELTDAVCDGAVSDDLAARAVGRFGPGVYVELALTAAAYVMAARVLDALGVPLEDTMPSVQFPSR
jgi:4-carboxymuconolactone decarboxylase